MLINNVLHPIILSPKQLIIKLSNTLPYLPQGTNYVTSLEIGNYPQIAQILHIKYFA